MPVYDKQPAKVVTTRGHGWPLLTKKFHSMVPVLLLWFI